MFFFIDRINLLEEQGNTHVGVMKHYAEINKIGV
jgi:hypothetical protein